MEDNRTITDRSRYECARCLLRHGRFRIAGGGTRRVKRSCGGGRSRAKSPEQRNHTGCGAQYDKHRIPGDQSFDVVVCVFGIFFVPDLHGAVRGLWRLVRPDGCLAITIWGAKMFEPADGTFREAVRPEDPELLKSIKPWNKIVEPDPLHTLLIECGATNPEVVAEPGIHPLNSPEDWWTIVLGSGYRSTVEALTPSARERVMVATIEAVRRQKIREMRADVVYAIARRSAGSGE
jgi:SAM-dependent methyltransferase